MLRYRLKNILEQFILYFFIYFQVEYMREKNIFMNIIVKFLKIDDKSFNSLIYKIIILKGKVIKWIIDI